MKQELKLPQV